jgi:hypothetical protein
VLLQPQVPPASQALSPSSPFQSRQPSHFFSQTSSSVVSASPPPTAARGPAPLPPSPSVKPILWCAFPMTELFSEIRLIAQTLTGRVMWIPRWDTNLGHRRQRSYIF